MCVHSSPPHYASGDPPHEQEVNACHSHHFLSHAPFRVLLVSMHVSVDGQAHREWFHVWSHSVSRFPVLDVIRSDHRNRLGAMMLFHVGAMMLFHNDLKTEMKAEFRAIKYRQNFQPNLFANFSHSAFNITEPPFHKSLGVAMSVDLVEKGGSTPVPVIITATHLGLCPADSSEVSRCARVNGSDTTVLPHVFADLGAELVARLLDPTRPRALLSADTICDPRPGRDVYIVGMLDGQELTYSGYIMSSSSSGAQVTIAGPQVMNVSGSYAFCVSDNGDSYEMLGLVNGIRVRPARLTLDKDTEEIGELPGVQELQHRHGLLPL